MFRHVLTLDMVRLRARLSHAARRTLSYRQVTSWLVDHGFTFDDDWLGNDEALRQLRIDEVLSHRERLPPASNVPTLPKVSPT